MKIIILLIFTLYFSCLGSSSSKLFKDSNKVIINSANENYENISPETIVEVDKEAEIDYIGLQNSVVYPEEAKKASIQGTVHVQVLIGADGIPKKARILSSDNIMLSVSALNAFKKFRGFKPAIQKNKPVATWMTIPIKYKLNNDNLYDKPKGFWELLWDLFILFI